MESLYLCNGIWHIVNKQIESWNQQNRNEENNTKNQWEKELVLQEKKQNRQIFIQANQKAEREYPI